MLCENKQLYTFKPSVRLPAHVGLMHAVTVGALTPALLVALAQHVDDFLRVLAIDAFLGHVQPQPLRVGKGPEEFDRMRMFVRAESAT